MPDATHDLDAVLDRGAAWLVENRGVVFATVITTWGSSPRPPGSKLAVNDAGEFVGSVSGGCIEVAVIAEALALIRGERGPGVLSFGVSDAAAWEVGLACGGRVEVFIERAQPALLGDVRDARSARRQVALVTTLGEAPTAQLVSVDGANAAPEILADVRAALHANTARVIETASGPVLVEPHNPPLRLAIIGAVHVAEPLAQMAALAGFAVTIIDPRRAWATAARFPGQTLVTDWADVALAAMALDARCAVVALTHDPKLDDPGLLAALRSDAFYIGCLGSKKTHAARRDRLSAHGVGDQLERLHGPVGLAIGAKSPAEIAVSILAEIIATLHDAAIAKREPVP